ncbi:MAG: YceD family protein [Hyphomicrobiaceae bacterium]
MTQISEGDGNDLGRVLDWTHDVRLADKQDTEIVHEATPAELAAVAAALGVLSCDGLRVRYALRPAGKTRYVLTGVIELAVTQSCVVTLEPVTTSKREEFSLELWPREDLPAIDAGVVEDLDDDDPEPIDSGVIAIGRLVLEHAACMIDPYPRKPGVAFSWVDQAAEASDSGNPFAKLKGLRGQS